MKKLTLAKRFDSKCCILLLYWLLVLSACQTDTVGNWQAVGETPSAAACQPDAQPSGATAPAAPSEREQMEIFCQKILEQLWQASDLRYGRRRPVLLVKQTKETAAAYGSDTIIVEMLAIQVCQSLGSDRAEGALAFLIAHELAHFFQQEQTDTWYIGYRSSFLGQDKAPHGHDDIERGADLGGAFNLYLAHFSLDTATMAALINALYLRYELDDNTSGYPPKQERQATARLTLQHLSELVTLYEHAAFLAAIGDFDAAIEAYQILLGYYGGPEVYANLGTAEARKALFLLSPQNDPRGFRHYLFPLETEWDTPLRQEPGPRTYASNDPSRLLADALAHLDSALARNPRYEAAALNRLIVLVLKEKKGNLGSIRDALDGYARSFGSRSPGCTAAQLTYGIACACFGQNDTVRGQADSLFQLVARSPDVGLAAMARHNLRQRGKPLTDPPADPLPKPPHRSGAEIGDLCAYRFSAKPLSLCPAVRVERNGSTLLVWEKNGRRTVLQRMAAEGGTAPPQMSAQHLRLSGGDGIQVSVAQKVGFRWEKGRLKESFRFCREE